jgi:hypothetical protein
MYAAALFRRWNPLYAVAAGFTIEDLGTKPFNFKSYGAVPGAPIRARGGAVPSSLLSGKLEIGDRKLCHEDSGIFAAFAGTDFDGALGHDHGPWFGVIRSF